MGNQSQPVSYLALAFSILSMGYSSIISFNLGKSFKQDVLMEVHQMTSQIKIDMFPELLSEMDAHCTCGETSLLSSSTSSSSSSYSSSDGKKDDTDINWEALEFEIKTVDFPPASHFIDRLPEKRNLQSLPDVESTSDQESLADVESTSDQELSPDVESTSDQELSSDMECDGTLFRLDIETDEWPFENFWFLTNEETNSTVMWAFYEEEDSFQFHTHEECLELGNYTFELFDWGDGIGCRNHIPCFNITLNNDVHIPGAPFLDYVTHSFDSSPSAPCLVGDVFLLQVLQEDQVVSDDEINSNSIRWELSGDEPILLQPTTVQNENNTFTDDYFACLVPGVYTFDMIFNTNTTYRILIKDEMFVQESSSFENDFVTHSFALTSEGGVYERQCHRNPPLMPVHPINNFQYDNRVEKIMNVVRSISSQEVFNDFESPQYKAACWLLHDDPQKTQPEDQLMLQRYLIAIFLYSINLNAEVVLPPDICDYFSIGCDDQGHVIGINFSNQNFLGTLPSEISHLTFLGRLGLGGNRLEGTIPTELGNLHRLWELWLYPNRLTGTIPTEIGKLSNLENLVLMENKLQGSFPSQIGSLFKLKWISLSDNMLEGSIPEEIYQCTQLEKLQLSLNQFTGTISPKIRQLQQLEQLEITVNSLTGPIPSEIGELSFVTDLEISDNKLTNSLPTEIGNMENLDNIFFFKNLLTGPLPSEIGQLKKARNFYLHHNKLSSSIPEVFGEMNALEEIRLSSNQLTGRISDSFWEVIVSMDFTTKLHMEDNKLSGTVPETFCTKEKFDFRVDNLPWFNDMKVTCPCCGETPECYVWDEDVTTVFGTIRPPCPANNIKTFEFFSSFKMEDLSAGILYEYNSNILEKSQQNICMSPTGCYKYSFAIETLSAGDRLVFDKFKISYKAKSKSIVWDKNGCDDVMICGTPIDDDHPRRSMLNHITQLAIPDLSILDDLSSHHNQALCWIMTQDDKVDEYNLCDGTILQRYVMALFYLSHKEVFDFDDLSSQDTCEWPGVTCDSRNKYIQEINLSNKKLQGTIITEIGLLQSLRKIDLSDNKLTGSLVTEIQYLHNIQALNFTSNELVGTINPSLFSNLPNLETLHIASNMIAGEIPKEILNPPKLKEIHLSNNLLIGNLPNDFPASQSIELFSISNNLLQGTIPEIIFQCKNLIHVDMSSNGFIGVIPPNLGDLSKIEVIRFNKNKMTGSIPTKIFDASNIQKLMLQSNRFTGSIPTQVGVLSNASIISMNHNFLKGTIPTEFENLNKMLYLHLHSNQFTGLAPRMNFTEFKPNNFITDCGWPSFLLSRVVTCETCSMCCNSDGSCQDTDPFHIPIEETAYISALIPPVALIIIAFVVTKLKKLCGKGDDDWDLDGIYSDDSVYCFVLSTNKIAWALHATTLGIQIWLFATYAQASKNLHEDSDFKYVFRCPDTDMECSNTSTISNSGWVLFLIVTFLYLARDFAMSFRQIVSSINPLNIHLLASGFGILTLTAIALMTSIVYNFALAEKNTDLLTNAVILLFINDLDEQFLALLLVLAPDWTTGILNEIEARMYPDRPKPKDKYGEESNDDDSVDYDAHTALPVDRPNLRSSLVNQQVDSLKDNNLKRFTTYHLPEGSNAVACHGRNNNNGISSNQRASSFRHKPAAHLTDNNENASGDSNVNPNAKPVRRHSSFS